MLIPSLEVLIELSMKSSLDRNIRRALVFEIDKDIIVDDIERWHNHYLMGYLKSYYAEVNFLDINELLNRTTKHDNRELVVATWMYDALSITCIVDCYSPLYPEYLKVSTTQYIDLLCNGCRGVYLEFQMTAYHYPIQLQIYTEEDYLFKTWHSKYIVKDDTYYLVTPYMRNYFDDNPGITEEQFVDFLNKTMEQLRTL